MQYLIFMLLVGIQLPALAKDFSFHLHDEPYSLDPASIRGISGTFIYGNLFRGLYSYHSKKGLQKEGAEDCNFRTPKKLVCSLSKNHKWSNGERVTAQQYVNSFQRLVDPKTKTIQTDLLLPIKNAKAILAGSKKPTSLGIKALSQFQLQIDLVKKDFEFLYKLINPTLAPIYGSKFPQREKAESLDTTGPYKVKKWSIGNKIELERNSYYLKGNPNRPNVTVYFIGEDNTAATLYDSGRLNFLRRVPISEIPYYKNAKDFIQVGVARNDYIGFGPDIKAQPQLRKAMSLALDYEAFARLLHAKGTPGCPSIPPHFMNKVPCFKFSPKKAKEIFDSLPKSIKEKRWSLAYSKSGGESIKKSMEWLQFQWKKNLGMKIDLVPLELGMFYQRLRSDTPSLFRKGVSMDRPTCLAALEVFSKSDRENYIKMNEPEFEKILDQLNSPLANSKKKQLCQAGVELMMNKHLYIPLGEIHFSMRVKEQVKGWDLNEMNQLDLSALKITPTK